jgi:hypothetical protein
MSSLNYIAAKHTRALQARRRSETDPESQPGGFKQHASLAVGRLTTFSQKGPQAVKRWIHASGHVRYRKRPTPHPSPHPVRH